MRKTARGFVYYVSVTGVTGARTSLPKTWKAAAPSYAPLTGAGRKSFWHLRPDQAPP